MPSARVTILRPHAPAPTIATELDQPTPERALGAANQLLAFPRSAARSERANGQEAELLRKELHRAGVALDGWPSPAKDAQRLPLAPSAAAVLALLGQDDGVVRLRAWASLAAATRWLAACTGEPLDAAAFFGAARREDAGSIDVTLRLSGTSTPLVLPVLNLVHCDWKHVDLTGARPALSAAFGVDALWQHLPASAGLAASLGLMAETLSRVVEQASPPAETAEVLRGAAAELRRLAQLPSAAEILREAALLDVTPAEHRSPPASRRAVPKPAPAKDALVAPAAKAIPTQLRAQGLSYARMADGPSAARTAAPSRAVRPSAPASLHALVAPGPRSPKVGAASSPVRRGKDVATRRPVSPLASASAELLNEVRASAVDQANSPPERLAPSRPDSRVSSAVEETDQGGARHLATSLASVAAAEPEAAWALLGAAAAGEHPVAPHLEEPEVLRLLAAPPARPLAPALAGSVALWLRRLAAQPTLATAFVADHPEAQQLWAREEGLLVELGRLLGGRSDAKPPAASVVEAWLARATAQAGAVALMQTLNDVALQHPLYGATLTYLQQQQTTLPGPLLVQFVGITAQKLANKRAAGEEVRQRFEPVLAALVDEVPLACQRLDFGKNPAWRILSRCNEATQRTCLEMVLASSAAGRPSGHAMASAPVELLHVASNAASLELQLVAAALVYKKWPQDVVAAQAVAALLTRNKKALTSPRSTEHAGVGADAISALLAPCIVAGKTWSGDVQRAAQAVWGGLEAIGFAVPYFVAAQRFDDAAEIMHRVHAHPHLTAQSLARLAASLSPDDAGRLTSALTYALGVDVACTSVHVGQLKEKARKKYITETARTGYLAEVAQLERRLSAAVDADQGWMAACATHALIAWANKETTGDTLFAPDGAPTRSLFGLFDIFAQRQAVAPLWSVERPMRRLVALLRDDVTRRAGIAKVLLNGIYDASSSRSLWTKGGLSLPIVEALLESTPEADARQRLAACFGEAYGLWPVVTGGEASTVATYGPGGWSVTENSRTALAEASAVLLPKLVLASEATSFAAREEDDSERVRTYVDATIVHVLREPEHHLWRLPSLLQQANEAGTLDPAALRSVARQAAGLVVRERLEVPGTDHYPEAVAIGIMAAWSLCQLAVPDLQLALALVDGACDAMDTCREPRRAYHALHVMLLSRQRVPHGEASAAELSRMQHAIVAQINKRSDGCGYTFTARPDAPKRAKKTHLLEDSCAPAPFATLHQWLATADATDVAQGYGRLVGAWVKQGDDDLLGEQPIRAAIRGVSYACLDGELRAKVLPALAAHGDATPKLNQALLQAMGQRLPFSAAEGSVLRRIRGYTPPAA